MSSSKLYLTVGIVIAAVAFGGWRMLVPGGGTTSEVSSDVASLVSTTLNAQFTGAEATLDAQRTATGSYAGAPVQPPITLVRADTASYCLQLEQGPVLQHVSGPGGHAEPGAC